jgi:hypothetical protein
VPDHLPLESWERNELLSRLWSAQQIQRNVQKELDRRGQRDEWKWAYEVPVYGKTERGATYLTSGYMLFESASEAYSKVRDIALQYERDPETAPYHVIKVWLPEDHPASADPKGGDGTEIAAPLARGAVGSEASETPAPSTPPRTSQGDGDDGLR